MEVLIFMVILLVIGGLISLATIHIPRLSFANWTEEAKEYLNLVEEKATKPDIPPFWSIETLIQRKQAKGIRNPLIELGFVVLCLPLLWITDDVNELLLLVGVFASLYIGAIIDLENMYIPDDTIVFGLGFTFLYWIMIGSDLTNYVFGVMIGYGFIALLRWMFYQIRGIEGVGLGDAKMFALTGALVGGDFVFHLIITACFLAVFFGWIRGTKTNKKVPFGPAIALSGVAFFYINAINQM